MNAHTPAFPCEWDYIGTNRADANGMSLRDYFAAKALAAIIAEPVDGIQESVAYEMSDNAADLFASCAYQFADAMLRARSAK